MQRVLGSLRAGQRADTPVHVCLPACGPASACMYSDWSEADRCQNVAIVSIQKFLIVLPVSHSHLYLSTRQPSNSHFPVPLKPGTPPL